MSRVRLQTLDLLEIVEQAHALRDAYVAGNDQALEALVPLGPLAIDSLLDVIDVHEERVGRAVLAFGQEARPALERRTTDPRVAALLLKLSSMRGDTSSSNLSSVPSTIPIAAARFDLESSRRRGEAVATIAALPPEQSVPILLEAARDRMARGPVLVALRAIDHHQARSALQTLSDDGEARTLAGKYFPTLVDPAAFRATFRRRGRFGALLVAISVIEPEDAAREAIAAVLRERHRTAWIAGHGPFVVEDELDEELVVVSDTEPDPSLGFVKAASHFERSVDKRDPTLSGEWLEVIEIGGLPVRLLRRSGPDALVLVSSPALAAALSLEVVDSTHGIGWLTPPKDLLADG